MLRSLSASFLRVSGKAFEHTWCSVFVHFPGTQMVVGLMNHVAARIGTSEIIAFSFSQGLITCSIPRLLVQVPKSRLGPTLS